MKEEIQKYNREITSNFAIAEVKAALLETTFRGLTEVNVKKAMLEGMMRGFSIQDFIIKNIYAIPFMVTDKKTSIASQNYSLIVSRDHLRKVGMKNGIISSSAPTFVEEVINEVKTIISCTVTVKRKIENQIGEFSATAYFSEYNTNQNLWSSKKHTMLEKVAEMQALRKACPEDLSNLYVEEEMQQAQVGEILEVKAESEADTQIKKSIASCTDLKSLLELYRTTPKGRFDAYFTEKKIELSEKIKQII